MADTPARSTGKRLDVRQPHRRAIRNGMFEWNLERAQEAAARRTAIEGDLKLMREQYQHVYGGSLVPPGNLDACRALVTPEPPFWLVLWRLITRRA